MPKVSVIMPSLNVGQYIKQCIDSVCNQTLKDIEIICVDAGSTDGTLEILEKYASLDPRITLINSDKRSYGYQMNLGIKASSGEYIGIIDTDDYADPMMFEKLYSFAKSENADIVKSNQYRHSDEGDEFFEVYANLPYNKVFCPKDHLSIFMRVAQIWAGIYRRKFLIDNDICFLETPGASYQDEGFMMKGMISADRVGLLKDAFLHYRIDNVNSSVKSKDKVFFVRDEFLSALDYLDMRPDKKKYYEKILWTREAEKHAWNYNRLAEEFKYGYLADIQHRFQEGLNKDLFLRSHLSWRIWKMVTEVSENPLIYMRNNCSKETFKSLLKDSSIKKPSKSAFARWHRNEKLRLIPQTIIDFFSFVNHYGLRYCLTYVLKYK